MRAEGGGLVAVLGPVREIGPAVADHAVDEDHRHGARDRLGRHGIEVPRGLCFGGRGDGGEIEEVAGRRGPGQGRFRNLLVLVLFRHNIFARVFEQVFEVTETRSRRERHAHVEIFADPAIDGDDISFRRERNREIQGQRAGRGNGNGLCPEHGRVNPVRGHRQGGCFRGHRVSIQEHPIGEGDGFPKKPGNGALAVQCRGAFISQRSLQMPLELADPRAGGRCQDERRKRKRARDSNKHFTRPPPRCRNVLSVVSRLHSDILLQGAVSARPQGRGRA